MFQLLSFAPHPTELTFLLYSWGTDGRSWTSVNMDPHLGTGPKIRHLSRWRGEWVSLVILCRQRPPPPPPSQPLFPEGPVEEPIALQERFLLTHLALRG